VVNHAVSLADVFPVACVQWHPEVSVLFADISSYTAMSTQVEPEQVRAAPQQRVGS
jgi:class 3 adenylate cyclase